MNVKTDPRFKMGSFIGFGRSLYIPVIRPVMELPITDDHVQLRFISLVHTDLFHK